MSGTTYGNIHKYYYLILQNITQQKKGYYCWAEVKVYKKPFLVEAPDFAACRLHFKIS